MFIAVSKIEVLPHLIVKLLTYLVIFSLYLLGPRGGPAWVRLDVSAFRQNTPDSPSVWTSSNNSTQSLSAVRGVKRPIKRTLNVTSCFVSAFFFFFFLAFASFYFFLYFTFTVLLLHPSGLLTPGDVVKHEAYTHHRAAQIDFCLNWSLGVTVERYLDRRRGKGRVFFILFYFIII